MSKSSFSFEELETANAIELPVTETLVASDGVSLAYRRYIPESPRAVVLFYHGGGANSGAGYSYLGSQLQAQNDVLVYMPDIRGHGRSGGSRGDTPSAEQVWKDITTFIQHIRAEYPQLPLFLGGHSSGAGLVLNYTSYSGRESVDYYLFLSPEFGYRSKTANPSVATPFAKVNVLAFIANAISGGLVLGHYPAVRLNYPAEILASYEGLVDAYTVNMANALTPSSPHKQFVSLDRTFGLWIGADDELLSSSAVLKFAELPESVNSGSEASSIADARHLSILVKSHEQIGQWISSLLMSKD